MVCLIAKISPGPATNPHKLPCFSFGLQFLFWNWLSAFDIIDPIKIDVGVIVILASSVKSKSVLVTPKLQISG